MTDENAMAAWVNYFAESKNDFSGIVRVSSADEPIKEINELIRCYEIATRSSFVTYWHQGSFGKRTAGKQTKSQIMSKI